MTDAGGIVTSAGVRPIRHARRLAIVALVLAVAGGVVGYIGFVTGIDASLAGDGRPGLSIVVFFVGVFVLLLAVVLALVALLRTGAKLLATIALVLGLLPIAGLLVFALSFRR